MRALALGWLAGTLWLQTRADLPPSLLSSSLMVVGALALGLLALDVLNVLASMRGKVYVRIMLLVIHPLY